MANASELTETLNQPIVTNDAVVFGLLMCCLGIVFYTSQLKKLSWFYKIIPALLMCYLLPALLSTFNIISPKFSGLWPIAKNYFLPASLILMTLSTDLKGIIRLGPKALIMFFTATVGIILGGPTAEPVRDEFAILELDLIRVKGKNEPAQVFGLFGDETLQGNPAFQKLAEINAAMLSAYRGQAWDKATALLDAFEVAATALRFDFGTYLALYRDRLVGIKNNPVDADWDGVFTATSK